MNMRLWPREHGAYAQLGFPLLSGLVLGSPGAAAWLFAAAAILVFLANEPLAVLLGVRGQRLRQELAAPARLRLALLGVTGAAAGLAALWFSPPAARWLALVPAAFAGCLVPMVLARRLKTRPGELLAAAAFSAMHLPVAAAGGVTGALLWGPALMWFVATATASLAVYAIKSRVTGEAPSLVPVAAWSARLALLAAVALWIWVPGARIVALAACIPLAGVVVLNHVAPSTRKLKQVGWTVVATNALALSLLAIGIH